MRSHGFLLASLIFLILFAADRAESQVTHAGNEGGIPLTVGVGVSDYFIDWGHSRTMGGITAWADWRLSGLPGYLKGLEISAEGHHIDYFRPAEVSRMRQDSGLGGVSYQFSKWSRVRPYGKYLIGFGSIYFPTMPNGYNHDTRIILAPGGGIDIRLSHRLSIRGDYEYQYWRQIFGQHDLNPNGFSAGIVWDFGETRSSIALQTH